MKARAVLCVAALLLCSIAGAAEQTNDLWKLALQNAGTHRFSTLFTAQDVKQWLSNKEGLQSALQWCKESAITKVYIETFRGNYQADKSTLQNAHDTFKQAGFTVSGCVTTTRVGKPSTRWKEEISCYTDLATQDKLQAVFEYAAQVFDEIMIDDFYFTDCACEQCDAARTSRSVKVGNRTYPVPSDSWDDYRCELMVHLSKDRVLAPAKRVNPKARLIIKYPQWYDKFHERGYEVIRETADFDRIWVGTETRDYTDSRWGGTPQYEGYFIMRWLGEIGGNKCGGGWYDPLGTTGGTYIEQARQTVLGGARESMLFCYGALLRNTGPSNILALRPNIPELLQIAKEVKKRKLVGLSAYKPANSPPGSEPRVFDFVGMMGIPLVPCHEFPSKASAAFFSMHALKDPNCARELGKFVNSGKPVLITDGLVAALSNRVDLSRSNVQVLRVNGDAKSLLELNTQELNQIRSPLLKSLKADFAAPNLTAVYFFTDKSWVVENFNDQPVQVTLNGESFTIQPRDWKYHWN